MKNYNISANLKNILSKFTKAKGDKDLVIAAMDKLQPLITAANIGKSRKNILETVNKYLNYISFLKSM